MKKMLTKAEEQIMQTLWKLGKGGLREITDAMPEPKPHSNTVATILKILAEKDFIQIEPIGRVNLYHPKISKDEYSGESIKQIAQSYFDGSFNNVVSFLVENDNISVNDLELLVKQLKNK